MPLAISSSQAFLYLSRRCIWKYGRSSLGPGFRPLSQRGVRPHAGAFVPIQAQPGHRFQDAIDRVVGGSNFVGVFNPKDKCSLMMASKKPVEQGRSGSSDMEKSSGDGGESDADFGVWRSCFDYFTRMPSPMRLFQAESRHYLGLFLVSSAALLWEILLTRVYNVLFFYHFAFLAVSVAMSG